MTFSLTFLCLHKEKLQKKVHHERQPKACPFRTGLRYPGRTTFGSHRSWRSHRTLLR